MSLPAGSIDDLQRLISSTPIGPNDDRFEPYCSDATEIMSAPDIVVFPLDVGEVSRIVIWAREHDVPVVARGAGTGYSGGAIATHGGIVLSVEKLDKIIAIDKDNRTAIAESGVITHNLDLAANEVGLFYPPDPASHKESLLGGNIAECAGGLRGAKYGVTKDYVIGIEYVDAEGEICTVGSLSDRRDEFDIMSLLIGSEGTLGIVTKAQFRLLPSPEMTVTFLFTFADETDAAQVVGEIRARGVLPCVMEFMDHGSIAAVAEQAAFHELKDSNALLLVELDGDETEVAENASTVIEIAAGYRPLISREAKDHSERESLWEIRRGLSTAVKAVSRIKTSEDVCVPVNRFVDIVSEIQRVGESLKLKTAAFGHAADGNLHVCFLVDELTDEIKSRLESAKAQLLRATIHMGGTISAEHGIGITKKAFLEEEIGRDGIELLRAVKRSFDPENRLNPNKVF
jgi:glycolate oxidase